MEVAYLRQADEDLEFWKRSGNLNIQNKISALLDSIEESPFEGIGKPEALKYNHAGKWSRRINKEHRLIYEVEGMTIYIHSMRGHYE